MAFSLSPKETIQMELHSLWPRGCIRLLHAPHLNQPAALAGLSYIPYSLMPLGEVAQRESPCSNRSSIALPLISPCRDHSVTESALSGCLSASRPHTHGSVCC